MEKHLNNLNPESLKVGLKIHKGKTKYMTNHADSKDIQIDQQKIEKVTEFKYLGQTTHLKDTTKEEIYARIRAARSCFGKNKEILQDKQLPISLKKQVMDQCILPTMTYGCQTWSLNKQTTNKLRTAQRAMERKMLDQKLKDKISLTTGLYSTNYKVEAEALKTAAAHIEASTHASLNVVLLTDALSVLQALQSNRDTEINDLSTALASLCRRHEVTLQWIPSHCNLPGNEAADSLAKEGTTKE